MQITAGNELKAVPKLFHYFVPMRINGNKEFFVFYFQLASQLKFSDPQWLEEVDDTLDPDWLRGLHTTLVQFEVGLFLLSIVL